MLKLDFYHPFSITITILYSLCSNFAYIYHFLCSSSFLYFRFSFWIIFTFLEIHPLIISCWRTIFGFMFAWKCLYSTSFCHVRIPWEVGSLQPKRGSSSELSHAGTLIQSQEVWEINLCCLQDTPSKVASYSSQNGLSQCLIHFSTKWMMRIQEGWGEICAFYQLFLLRTLCLAERGDTHWPDLQWNHFLHDGTMLVFQYLSSAICNLLLGWHIQLPFCLLASARGEQEKCVVSAALTSVPRCPLILNLWWALGGAWMVKMSHSQSHSDNSHNITLEAHRCPSTTEFPHYFFTIIIMPTEVQGKGEPREISWGFWSL